MRGEIFEHENEHEWEVPGGRVELPTNPEGFRGCSTLPEMEDCELRILFCFQCSFKLARLTERADFFDRRQSQLAQPTRCVGMTPPMLGESLLEVDGRPNIMTSG